MHVTIQRKPFLAAFGKVARVAPARSPKPILQNVKFVASDDPGAGVTLTATDLETGLVLRVRGVSVLTPGSAILPTARVASILASATDDELDISIDGDQLVIRSPSATFRLPSENPELFPTVPSFSGTAYHAVAASDLRRLIRRTIFACDPDSTRYALGGCLLELADTSATMVATDGRRLARMTVPAEAEGGATPPVGSPVIPARALKTIDGALDDPESIVHVVFVDRSRSAVLVRTSDGSTVIYSRLVEGRFPDYRAVFPDASTIKIPLDVAAFRAAVAQASIVTSDESRGVDFVFSSGKLTLASRAADVGSSQVTVPISHDGPEVESSFDTRYLADALKTIGDDTAFAAELIDHKNAAVFRTDDGYSYVIMPITRDR